MIHERPGVYSSYDASSVVSARAAAKTIGAADTTWRELTTILIAD